MRHQRELANFLSRCGLQTGVLIAASGGEASRLQTELPSTRRIELAEALDGAAAIADGSLDHVFLDGPTEYGPSRRLLSAWFPKVLHGGFFGGTRYLDGILEGQVYGVRAAVGELARENRLLVRVTYDKIPAWFAIKPTSSPTPPRNIGLLTAADSGAASIAEHSVPNKQRYCDTHGYRMIFRNDGFDAQRPLAWSKIRFLREHLGDFDWLFWSDADSLIMDPSRRLEEFIHDAYDVVITQENLGVGVFNLNTGQIFVKNSDWSRWFLDEVYAQTQFINDRLWENRAAIHLWEREDLSGQIKVLAQTMFNSYLPNYTKGDFILHFPDMPNSTRAGLMRYWAQFART